MMWILSKLFECSVAIRNYLFDQGLLSSRKLPGAVISVGNIAVGGTGKSPFVEFVARSIQEDLGGCAVIVTRGYRSGLKKSEFAVYLNGQVIQGPGHNHFVADEARMQSLALPQTPVVVGAKRWRAVQCFLKNYPKDSRGRSWSHFVLDDGFQHRQIVRDQDIVLIDGRTPWGRLLPAGLFRELPKALSRATDIVVVKSSSRGQEEACLEQCRQFSPRANVFGATLQNTYFVLKNGNFSDSELNLLAVAGIAKPEDFFAGLKAKNYNLLRTLAFPDHGKLDLDQMIAASKGANAVVTTAKDWARDEKVFKSLNLPVFVYGYEVVWSGVKIQIKAHKIP